jgi:CBS domain-containing protein
LEPPIICLRGQTIRELQVALIESNSQFVVLLDRLDGKIVGLVTLHDLLRAQTERAGNSDDLAMPG